MSISKKHAIGPDYFLMQNDERLMRTHEAMVDLIHDRPANRNILDALSFGYGYAPDHFAPPFNGYEDSSDEDYYFYDDDDDDKYTSRTNNRYCGFSRSFLDRGLPKPLTAEEAERNAKELVDEEEKLKQKAEKKKLKKMRQKERRRQEKLEKENANKEKNKQVQVGSEKTKHADKDHYEHKNKDKNKNSSSGPPAPQLTSAAVQSSDSSSDEEDDKEEDSTMEPEELDMNSCFVSNAAAIAKRKLEQKPKPDKKPAQANARKPRESEQKATTTPQKQIDNKEEVKAEESVNANDFITRSMELAVIGNQYANTGNMEMAVKYFTDAIKHNPKEYKLFGNRSFCYEKMVQYEKSLTDAEIALSMNPKWIKGLYRKGRALVGLKRYNEARVTYGEVLKLDCTCKDAAEEIMRVQLMQLMEMGLTKEQSSNALIIHGTVERALPSLAGLPGLVPVLAPRENEFISVQQKHPQPKFPLRPLPQNYPQSSMPTTAPVPHQTPRELFPIWVGDLVSSITEAKLYDIFRSVGHVHNVRVLHARHCAFVNYTNKEDCEKAIQKLNGHAIDGTTLVVRYPDRIHTRLGVSRDASTESSGRNGKQPDECFFWRTYGCLKNERCTYKHIPENKGIDRHTVKPHT